jgi:hypothetical protein
MPIHSESRLLSCANWIYGIMLRAYPLAFRRAYSREMALAFRDRTRDVVQSNGTLTLVPFMYHTVEDWIASVARERFEMDTVHTVNRFSRIALTFLSMTALAPLLIIALPAMLTGHVPPPESDEGIGAHILQLSVAMLVPVGCTFLATADWKQPMRRMRQLIFPAATVAVAFGMLFYFEHVYLPARGYPLPRPGQPLLLLRRVLAAFH